MSRQRQTLAAAVDEVILLEDRAHVYRRGRLELAAGRSTLVIEDVAPVLVDKTLAVGVESGVGVTVVGARVLRETVFRDPEVGDDELSVLERELEELDLAIEALQRERVVVDQQITTLDRIVQMTYQDLSTDVSWGQTIAADRVQGLDELRDRERALVEKQAELGHRDAELQRTRRRLDARIDAASDPSSEERATIAVDVDVEAEVGATLRIDYVVPGACWRPQHRAELIEDGERPRVVFSTAACVWQNTGESWTDAQLAFSTERASLGTEPPTLADDRLRWRKKSEELVVQAREQVVANAGLGTGAPAAELPGIDDGGEAVNLRGAHRADVPSDGRPYRVPITEFEADVELDLVAYPELSPCVFTRTRQTNAGSAPVLAGPVELVRRSGPVGRTSTLFVAPDERFELGWGPEAELRLKRTTEVRDEQSRMLSSWVTREHEVRLSLSNLGAQARTLEVTERVPVSEIDKLKISVDGEATTGGRSPDKDGFVRWQVDLPAHGQERLKLAYTVKKHEDVVGF